MVPFVVFGLAGGEFARPVDRQAHRLHLLFHVGNVVIRPRGRGYLMVQRRIFRRHTECIPAHRHQDVIALHTQLARHHVIDRVVAHVPHVQFARRVRQHRAGVELRFVRLLVHAVGVGGVPRGLYGGFNGGRVIMIRIAGAHNGCEC